MVFAFCRKLCFRWLAGIVSPEGHLPPKGITVNRVWGVLEDFLFVSVSESHFLMSYNLICLDTVKYT